MRFICQKTKESTAGAPRYFYYCINKVKTGGALLWASHFWFSVALLMFDPTPANWFSIDGEFYLNLNVT